MVLISVGTPAAPKTIVTERSVKMSGHNVVRIRLKWNDPLVILIILEGRLPAPNQTLRSTERGHKEPILPHRHRLTSDRGDHDSGPGTTMIVRNRYLTISYLKLSVYVIYHKSQSEVHAMTDYDMMTNKVYHNNSTIKISEITYLSVLVRSITIPWSLSVAVVVRPESLERSSERESIVLTPNSLNFFHHHTPSYHSSWALFRLCCVFCFAGAMICWVTPSPYRCSIVIVLYGGAMTQKVHRVSPLSYYSFREKHHRTTITLTD